MEIKQENIIAAYNTADDNGKRIIAALFGEKAVQAAKTSDIRPVTERVKTFEDACNELGELNSLVVAYKKWIETSASLNKSFCEDIEAYLKLRIICAALNEGWQPKFTEDELRWYPWFYLYTQKDIDRISDEWQQGTQVIEHLS